MPSRRCAAGTGFARACKWCTPWCVQEPQELGAAQVASHMPLLHRAKVSAVSPPEQPLVQLMLPAADELAAKAPGAAAVGAPGPEISLAYRT